MNEEPAVEADPARLREWLRLARENAPRCFVCMRIAETNAGAEDRILPIRISGIDLAPETQLAHLSRCVGGGRERP